MRSRPDTDDEALDFDPAELFAAEVDEHLSALEPLVFGSTRSSAADASGRDEVAREIMRHLHSVKGAAAMVGRNGIAAIALAGEELVAPCVRDRRPWTAETQSQLRDVVVRLRRELRHAGGGATPDVAAAVASVPRTPEPAPSPRRDEGPGDRSATIRAEISQTIRVSQEELDELTDLIGELRSATEKHELLLRQFRRHRQTVKGLSRDFAVRSPDELAAAIEEVSNRADVLKQLLDEYHQRQDSLLSAMEARIRKARTKSLHLLLSQVPRLAYELAQSQGKEVETIVSGDEELVVDGRIVDLLTDPLVHLLRNAVDHGIEPPDVRVKAGKPAAGRIEVSAARVGGAVQLVVCDDGRGVDRETLARNARAARELGNAELLDLICRPGVTSRRVPTALSGRGVGMDVVRRNIRRMAGNLELDSHDGQGTRFTITVPLSIANIRCLVCRIGSGCYAFPTGDVDSIAPVRPDCIRVVDGRQVLVHETVEGTHIAPLFSGGALGLTPSPDTVPGWTVLFAVPDGDGAWALAVEAVVGVLRLYVRPSDPRLQDNLPITGTAILPDGQVAVVMSAAEVSKRLRGMGQATGTALQVPGREPAPRPRVLLVEDSFTTRELERSVLTTEGFDVVQTTDGREALAVLAESEPGSFQLILTDVEMPRLDGIAMTRQVRDDPKWRNIPVVVLSHRDRDEDKRAGLEAGANAYFVKTDFRQRSFLAALHGLIG